MKEIVIHKLELTKQKQYFCNLSSVCNEEHLSYCTCQQSAIKSRQKELFELDLEELKKNGLEENTELIKERQMQLSLKAKREVAEFCTENNIKCHLEEGMILEQLTYFEEKYTLSDPRVFVVLESLFRQMLSAYRMQLHSNQKGILNIWYDKEGNKRYSLNPVEEIKLKYDEARIKAIETLNKMIEGEKSTTLHINTTPIPIEDIFK